jgi:hypothetical protein
MSEYKSGVWWQARSLSPVEALFAFLQKHWLFAGSMNKSQDLLEGGLSRQGDASEHDPR